MTDYEKLEWLISEADVLVNHAVNPSTPGFQLWFSEAERFLIKRFGPDSFEYTKLKQTKFMPAAMSLTQMLSENVEKGSLPQN